MTTPWPEFAEYDCFACHHDLQAASWRQEPGRHGSKPGALAWGDWYLGSLSTLTGATPNEDLARLLSELRREMAKGSPDVQIVARAARAAAEELKQFSATLVNLRYDDVGSLNRLLAELAREDREAARSGWDGAAQTYLGMAAIYHTQRDLGLPPDSRIRAAMSEMSAVLAFPRKPGLRYESPREVDYLTGKKVYVDAVQRIRTYLGE